jgi:hypothetical protein
MDPVIDIFGDAVFGMANLRKVAKSVTYVPQYLGTRNIFQSKPLTGTDKVIIYEENGEIRLIPTTERGGPEITQKRDTGKMFLLQAPRIAKMDSIRASELLGVANEALSRTLRIRTAAQLVQDRLAKLKSDKALTLEYHRFGALQGKLYDADGTTLIYDYFSEFSIAAPTPVDVDFTMPEEDLMIFFQDTFFRPIMRALKDRKTPTTQIGALVGDAFWAQLMKHPGFRRIYELEMQARSFARAANPLVQPNAWMEIDFGGVLWINYMGTDDGTTIAVPVDEATFFPIGARDVFDVYWAPGETIADVGGQGLDEYVYIQPDVRNNMVSHIDVHVRAYPLYACIYPKALMRAVLA